MMSNLVQSSLLEPTYTGSQSGYCWSGQRPCFQAVWIMLRHTQLLGPRPAAAGKQRLQIDIGSGVEHADPGWTHQSFVSGSTPDADSQLPNANIGKSC